MADNHLDVAQQIQEHQRTWGGFVAMMKWSTIVTVILVALVVFLIAK